MSFLQIFLLFFFVFALLRTMKQFRAHQLPVHWTLLWVIVWVGAGVMVLLPQTTDIAARLVGVGRGVDVVIYLAIVSLFYLLFRLYARLEGVEREITKLVRMIALNAKEDASKKDL
ncbi:TPA: DUF2304 domain-containing protein [Candidatus Uhrbacteria bacterium]|uniref:DUF2304 domain-containing protein n=2 Tax=Candidatus Uhriibacteriota TaxID=1752732 RepID=A0A0G1T5W9_9BACT|nr:MAG: hypothetical protein UX45_C0012G0048 [Candidatus Uhrbacteria bacterium GW2011_GWF2_46_218]KKU40805.1 MAG: hypothetical protein UX57_C0010G0049 [Candidatus Uhrbacteria bacterium GW2011_GWE2_46_68]HBK34204.1 DUF2304 domain-containing protein [Candidatus Uhrbacteria bacterium]HCB19270.1 DUF2304 domain-containing protein [Candidatus Uhrbacteria bacterium]